MINIFVVSTTGHVIIQLGIKWNASSGKVIFCEHEPRLRIVGLLHYRLRYREGQVLDCLCSADVVWVCVEVWATTGYKSIT